MATLKFVELSLRVRIPLGTHLFLKISMFQKQEKNYFSWIDLIKSVWFLWNFGKVRKKYLLLFILLFFILLYSIVPALIVGKIVNFFTNYQKGDTLTPLYFYSALLGVSYAVVSLARLKVKKKPYFA